jgi:hypothetical protein
VNRLRDHVTLIAVHHMDAHGPARLLTLEAASRSDSVASGKRGIGHSPASKSDCALPALVTVKQKELVRQVPRVVAKPYVRPWLKVGLMPHDALAVEFQPVSIDF